MNSITIDVRQSRMIDMHNLVLKRAFTEIFVLDIITMGWMAPKVYNKDEASSIPILIKEEAHYDDIYNIFKGHQICNRKATFFFLLILYFFYEFCL